MDVLEFFFEMVDRMFVDRFYRAVVFFAFGLVLRYIFSAIANFNLMKRRKIKMKFLAFVPMVSSTYALGSISDSINENYFNKTFSRFVILMLRIIQFCGFFFLFYFLSSRLPNFSIGRVFEFFVGDTLMTSAYEIDQLFGNMFDFYFVCCCLVFCLVITIIYLIYLFRIYYNIFSEYGSGLHKFLIFISIFGFIFARFVFLPDFLVLLIGRRQSRFEKLNSSKNYV